MAHVLLVEPYLGGSHRAWAEGWRDHSRHEVEIVGHGGTHWRWRMRGGAVSLAREVRDRTGPAPDVVVASNMLDLASFRGLVDLPGVVWVQYLHENQLTYPRQEGEALDTGLAWMQWRGLVAADEIWSNSAFQRDELLAGLDRLLGAVPDHDHQSERTGLESRLLVIPPGVDVAACRPGERRPNPRPLVVSNQRWHHDKDVGAVLRSLRRIAEAGVEFDVAVIGDHEGGEAERLGPILDDLGDRVIARGLETRADYLDLLRRADIVVSAARGENFGIAVVEAIAAGARPVLPDALAYPEVVPEAYHDLCLYDPGELGRSLREAIEAIAAGTPTPEGLTEAADVFAWPTVAATMDDRIDELRRV